MQHKTLQGLIWAPHQKDRNYSTVLNGTHLAWEFFFLSDSPFSVVNHWRDPHFFICSLTEPPCTAWSYTHRNTQLGAKQCCGTTHQGCVCHETLSGLVHRGQQWLQAAISSLLLPLVQECNVPKHISTRMQGQTAAKGMGEMKARSETNLVQRC